MRSEYDFDGFFVSLRRGLAGYDKTALTKLSEMMDDSPFVTLISCILSLRTKDEVTVEASIRLLERRATPEGLLLLSEGEIAELIYPVGFYKTKARTIQGICKVLIEEYDGAVPRSLEELMALKGVGRKTANIVMVYGHHMPGYLPIDTHCHRIPNRLGWIETKTPEQTEFALKEVLPEEYWMEFNDLFVMFGQRICMPVSPWCSRCPVSGYCDRVGIVKSR